MARGARKSTPTTVAMVPPMMNPVPALVGEGQQDEAGPEQQAARRREAVGRLGTGWAPGQGGHDRHPGGGACRPPGGGDGGDERQHQGGGDRPPRQGEAVDAVLDDRLQSGANANQPARPTHGADRGRRGAHGRAVGQHDQAHVAVGGAERAEHARGPAGGAGPSPRIRPPPAARRRAARSWPGPAPWPRPRSCWRCPVD